MSRTSIPIDTDTKEQLSSRKRESETWDEFLLRLVTEASEGMTPGSLSEEEADHVMDVIREGRDR